MLPSSVFGQRLRDSLGEPRQTTELGSSPRSRVWRVELDGGLAVVKQIVSGADVAQRFLRELAALRLASSSPVPVVPRLLGTDASARVLVLEHLDEGRPWPGWQRDYAAALARLHACGRGAVADLPLWQAPDDADVADFLDLARQWRAEIPSSAASELKALVERCRSSGGSGLLHGDPCPSGNVLYTGGGIRFIDFEQSSTGNGIFELAYPRIGFPTCYSSPATSAEALDDLEKSYRATWIELTGTEPGGSMADACAAWTIRGDCLVERAERGAERYLRRIATTDWTWGKATARERLAFRLDVTARRAAGSGELPAVAALCHSMREAMRRRWPRLRVLTDPRLNY
ncbi:MAG: phosphotransferase [Stackebrandtia sp.]